MSQHAVGYNNVDVDAATRHGVAICNTPGVLNAAVADLTMAIIIMLARRLLEFEAYSRSGAWARGEPYPPLAHEISGKTLGVIGFGRIGREVARRMQAIGCASSGTTFRGRIDRHYRRRIGRAPSAAR